MDFLPSLLLSAGGGVAAMAIDDAYPEYAQKLGPVTITPGAMGAAGLSLILVMAGGRNAEGKRAGWKKILGQFTTGALTVETAKIMGEYVLPKLKGEMTAPSNATRGAVAGYGYPAVAGYPGYPAVGVAPPFDNMTNRELSAALMSWREVTGRQAA